MIYRLLKTSFLLFLTLPLWAKPVIIMDAGSTGTRLYIYEVENGQASQVYSVKLKPELSSLDPKNQAALNQYFNQLVGAVEGVLSPEEKANTPFHLYATAGIRMLPEEQQNALFQAALSALAAQAQTFGYPAPLAENVRVITGSEEAAYIWLAGNYLSGKFSQDKLTPLNTAATLEMGGASSEIAFISPLADTSTVTIQHGETSYPVYGVGYDGLGANEALKALRTSETPGFEACFPVGAPYPLSEPLVIGTGDFNTCVKAIKHELIDPSALYSCEKQTPGECSRLGEYQPRKPLTHSYLLSAGFYYLFNALELADQTVTHKDFLSKAEAFCALSWDEVQEMDDSAANLINYCFNASLSKTLLDSWHIGQKDKLRAISSEWALGAALKVGS